MRRTASELPPRWMTVPTPPVSSAPATISGFATTASVATPRPTPTYVWVRARPRVPFFRLLPNVLLLPYGLALFLLTWLPASQAGKVTGIVGFVARLLDPRIPYSVGYPVLEFLANIALFVPLGALLAWGWPRLRWSIISLMGFATTVTIECVQWGIPSRFPAISDIVSNTLGTMIGAGFVALVAAALSRRGSSVGA